MAETSLVKTPSQMVPLSSVLPASRPNKPKANSTLFAEREKIDTGHFPSYIFTGAERKVFVV
jgi:hypothetical protein